MHEEYAQPKVIPPRKLLNGRPSDVQAAIKDVYERLARPYDAWAAAAGLVSLTVEIRKSTYLVEYHLGVPVHYGELITADDGWLRSVRLETVLCTRVETRQTSAARWADTDLVEITSFRVSDAGPVRSSGGGCEVAGFSGPPQGFAEEERVLVAFLERYDPSPHQARPTLAPPSPSVPPAKTSSGRASRKVTGNKRSAVTRQIRLDVAQFILRNRARVDDRLGQVKVVDYIKQEWGLDLTARSYNLWATYFISQHILDEYGELL